MAAKTKPRRRILKDKDTDALATLFGIFWAALVLNPRGQQTLRATLKSLGLVKPRGALALTAAGERVMRVARAQHEGR